MLVLLASLAHAADCPSPGGRYAPADLDPEAAAHALAPVLFVEGAKNADRRHWDLPMAVDFDGDRVGANNADALRTGAWRDRIVPTLYWTVLVTDTHVFATYHAFHGLDWAWWPNLHLYEWHENDGENVQIVARREPGGLVVELVAAQAHSWTTFARVGDAPWASALVGLSERPAWTDGGRVAVLMEAGGHALFPAAEKPRRFEVRGDEPELVRGIRLAPSAGEVQPPAAGDRTGSYRLVSAAETFRGPDLLGEGRLMDQTFRYCDDVVGALELPRHYDASMLSGPGKRDSGIAPFALDVSLFGPKSRLGALFFDPAGRYPEVLGTPASWSRTYRVHPFALEPAVADGDRGPPRGYSP